MNTPTEIIIKALRVLVDDIQSPDGVPNACVAQAADRLEELQRELTEAIRERNKTVAELIKQRDEERAHNEFTFTPRPEPSRLEIAAMLKAGWFANPDSLARRDDDPTWWMEQADALIAAAAAREGGK